MDGLNFDINVDFGQVGSLTKNVELLSTYFDQLDSYGEAAINAVGGQTTDIGAALKNGMVEVNKNNIMHALEGIEHMDQNFTKIKEIYKAANDEIVARIKNESSSSGS